MIETKNTSFSRRAFLVGAGGLLCSGPIAARTPGRLRIGLLAPGTSAPLLVAALSKVSPAPGVVLLRSYPRAAGAPEWRSWLKDLRTGEFDGIVAAVPSHCRVPLVRAMHAEQRPLFLVGTPRLGLSEGAKLARTAACPIQVACSPAESDACLEAERALSADDVGPLRRFQSTRPLEGPPLSDQIGTALRVGGAHGPCRVSALGDGGPRGALTATVAFETDPTVVVTRAAAPSRTTLRGAHRGIDLSGASTPERCTAAIASELGGWIAGLAHGRHHSRTASLETAAAAHAIAGAVHSALSSGRTVRLGWPEHA